MKKVLIVSPHFCPVNAADMQRTRLALPYLRAEGWEPTVLAVSPESVEGAVLDPLLEKTYPSDVRVIRVTGLSPRYTRWAGIGSLWWRCARALRRAGDALLETEKFDLVFFSTTQFDAFSLGPRWLRRYGVPYVLDYQDPWVNDYYREHRVRPPGGPLKFWLTQAIARYREPEVLRNASGVIAVSPAYGPALRKRYPWFWEQPVTTIPFGASSQDIEIGFAHRPNQSLVPFANGCIHHVYAGRCGPDMTIALTILFRAFKRYSSSHPREASRHRFHFIGTDYAPPPLGRFWAIPVAKHENIAEHVLEHCYRVPYFDALYYLTHADSLIVMGSNDPTYSASKIFPYLLARRPLLVIAHEKSLMLPLALAEGIPGCYPFSNPANIDNQVDRIYAEWFVQGGYAHRPLEATRFLGSHGAGRMTQNLVQVFTAALTTSQPTRPRAA